MRTYIGRSATFLIPNIKLGSIFKNKSIRERIHDFISQHYGSYHIPSEQVLGFWKGAFDGDHTMFVVSFPGKENIPKLEDFLETLAHFMGEEAIFFQAGQENWLIIPEKDKQYQL